MVREIQQKAVRAERTRDEPVDRMRHVGDLTGDGERTVDQLEAHVPLGQASAAALEAGVVVVELGKGSILSLACPPCTP